MDNSGEKEIDTELKLVKPVDNFEEKAQNAVKLCVGKQMQVPPMYSAIKVNGKKLYEYARKGQSIEVAAREIEIYNIEITKLDKQKNQIEFVVECSKGTYIRTLCETIAEKMGTVGYMQELNRTKVGRFDISNAITIGELEKHKNEEKYLQEHIITMQKLFQNLPKIELNEKQLEMFLNGVKLNCRKEDGICNVYCKKAYIGVGIVKNSVIKRDIIV